MGEASTSFQDLLTIGVLASGSAAPTAVILRVVVQGRFQGGDATFHNTTTL
jgi:hypothetical protein